MAVYELFLKNNLSLEEENICKNECNSSVFSSSPLETSGEDGKPVPLDIKSVEVSYFHSQ